MVLGNMPPNQRMKHFKNKHWPFPSEKKLVETMSFRCRIDANFLEIILKRDRFDQPFLTEFSLQTVYLIFEYWIPLETSQRDSVEERKTVSY